MNFAGALSTFDIDLDDYERPLSAARAKQAGAEDAGIAEFALRLAPPAPAPWTPAVPARGRSDARPKRRTGRSVVWPPSGRAAEGQAKMDVETMRIFGTPHEPGLAAKGPSGRAKLAVAALAFGAAATVGALLALEAAAPASPKPMMIAETPDLSTMQLRGEVTFPSPADGGASFPNDGRQPAPFRIGGSDERKNGPTRAQAFARAPQPPHEDSVGSPPPVDTPILAALIAAASPAASQTPDPETDHAIPPASDGTPVAMTAPSGMDPGAAVRPGDAEKPGASPAPSAASQMDRSAHPSAPGSDPAANPSGKWTARIAVAAADTAAPAPAVETPVRAGAPARPRSAARPAARVPRVSADRPASPHAPPTAANPALSPLARAFGDLINSLAAPSGTDRRRASGGWAVQLGASGSESEARGQAARLSARYALALRGSPIDVHEGWVRGVTVYRLRVFGLSEPDATALCVRVKGDGGGCFYGR